MQKHNTPEHESDESTTNKHGSMNVYVWTVLVITLLIFSQATKMTLNKKVTRQERMTCFATLYPPPLPVFVSVICLRWRNDLHILPLNVILSWHNITAVRTDYIIQKFHPNTELAPSLWPLCGSSNIATHSCSCQILQLYSINSVVPPAVCCSLYNYRLVDGLQQ